MKFKVKEREMGYKVWDKISKKEQITSTDVGKKVWIAGEFKTKFRVIKSVHQPGEKGWLNGGVTVDEYDTGRLRFYTNDKCRLHPDNFKKR